MQPSYKVISIVSLAISSLLLVPPAVCAQVHRTSASAQDAEFRARILNGICCVPNLSSGHRAVRLKNGKSKTQEGGVSIEISIDRIVLGQLGNKPVALALMSDWEGGSGIFNSLLLYELHDGKAVTVGSYPLGDRTSIKSLAVSNGKVRIASEETIGVERGKRAVKVLDRSQFEKAECLQYELTEETKKDIDSLMEIWESISVKDPALTTEQKQKALAISNRHQKDRAAFAEAFRLALSAGGWAPGPHPLVFDNAGKPALCVDDFGENLHATIDLSTTSRDASK